MEFETNLNLIQHQVLGTLKSVSLMVRAHGSDAKGMIPIDKELIGYCSLHYGVLVDKMNNPEKYVKPDLDIRNKKITKEEVEIKKYNWLEVNTAIENLAFNKDIEEKLDDGWVYTTERVIKLTEKGFYSYNSQSYYKAYKRENLDIEVSQSTIKNTEFIKYTFWAIALTALFQVVIFFKSCGEPKQLPSIEQLQTLQREIDTLKFQTENSKIDLVCDTALAKKKDTSLIKQSKQKK
jgi:hypothetical protein